MQWQKLICLLLLVGSSAAVKFGGSKAAGQTGTKQASKASAAVKHHEPAKTHEVQHLIPETAFVRIFALPSSEAHTAQHRLGELLASSCKTYNRVGECKMYSAKVDAHHIRLLKFTEGANSSVVAYMLQENESEIEKALEACVKEGRKDVMSHENGGDYRCYETQAVKIPTDEEVLALVEDHMKQAGLWDQLKDAPHKSVFLTSDPKAIIFQESQRLTGDNKDADHFTQTLRDSFRPIVEWLAWQYQQFNQLAKGHPMLYCHAEELDQNEAAEVNRVLDFMGIGTQAHASKKVVTATLGEENYQRNKLKNDIATLPAALSADIDEFLLETLQEKQLVEKYIAAEMGNRTALWPPKNVLQTLAFDNTLLVTAVTCEYAPLIVNWLKHLHDIHFPCYMVVALDDTIYDFLHNWLPDHVVRAPPNFIETVPRQYAVAGSAAMRHVSRARVATLKAINKQGYNVAWADADIAFTKNVFTVISRWWDLEAIWVDGDDMPLGTQDKTLGYELKFSKNDTRKISPSFLYFKGSENARSFLDKWHNASSVSSSVEDGAVLNQLLRDPAVNKLLNIQMLAEADFPSGQTLFEKQPAAFKKEWESSSYAWAHPDNAGGREDKIKLLSEKFWKVVPEDPMPNCPKALEEYLPNGTAISRWPPAEKLEKITIDNTIFVTSATCEYTDLVSNWIKRVWDLGISCFFVAGADESVGDFLKDWVPDHTAQMPANIVNQVSGFAKKNTSEYTKVQESKPKILRHILDQGYNVAWSDADVWWLKNPFTLFDKMPDMVVPWAVSSGMLQGGVFQSGKLVGESEGKIGSSFLYVKPSKATITLMDAWAAALDSSSYVDDAAALSQLLLRDEYAHLSIGVFASPLFPTLQESTNGTSADLKDAWTEENLKPAWIHADGMATHDGKVAELQRLDSWLLRADDPQPMCERAKPKGASKSKSEGVKSLGAASETSKERQTSKKSPSKPKFWGKKKHSKLELGE